MKCVACVWRELVRAGGKKEALFYDLYGRGVHPLLAQMVI